METMRKKGKKSCWCQLVLVTKTLILIDTTRGNAHHCTDYKQTEQYCRGGKKEIPADKKKRWGDCA